MKIHRFQIELMWLFLEMMFLGTVVQCGNESNVQPMEKGGLQKQIILAIKARPPP